MLITCTTKGCMASSEAKLDRSSGEVICEECGNPVVGITPFMKKSLEGIGQILRSKTKQAFQTQCPNCNQTRTLYVRDEKAYCSECNNHIVVSAIFLNGLKQHLQIKSKEEDLQDRQGVSKGKQKK